jgi:ABC-2 type transport system ATP-binding protein
LSEPRDLAEPIRVNDVSRSFGEVVAIDRVTMTVPQGALLGLIGASGSGKTTLIRMLTGTLLPTSGEIQVLGERPHAFLRATRERIGYVPQDFVLYPDLTASENVAFVASLFGIFWWRRRRRVREVLQLLGLWEVRDRRAKDLSGGMRRRLEVACGLVHEPFVLFIDEPTAGVDPLLARAIWEEFRRMRETQTLLVTTQSVEEAELCDHVAVLHRGRVIALDTPEALRHGIWGGEVVEVTTERPIDGEALRAVPGVSRIRQTEPRKIIVVADDAGAATPRLVEAIRIQNSGVAAIDPYQASFSEVFAAIVERAEAELQTARVAA